MGRRLGIGALAGVGVAACVVAALAGAAGMTQDEAQESGPDTPAFRAWTFEGLEKERAEAGRPYLPFLDEPAIDAGLYVLPAGAEDRQSPHDRDEIYYVVEGRGKFRVGGESAQTVNVGPGSVLFVRAELEHRFLDIEEDLKILVVFGG